MPVPKQRVINFTRRTLDALTSDGKPRAYVFDRHVSNLGLIVSQTGVKSFICQCTQLGKTRRITLGKYPSMTIEQARRSVPAVLTQIHQGIDPVAQKRRERRASVSLGEVLETYLEAKRHRLKAYTVADYRRSIQETWSDYLARPMTAITASVVLNRNQKRGQASPARTNNAMRVLRALFRFAQRKYGRELFPDIPTDALHEYGVWHKVKRRQTYLKAHQIRPWVEAVNTLPAPIADGFMFLLYSGARLGEAQRLEWINVDLEDRSFLLVDTKSGDDVELPLPAPLVDRLKVRQRKEGFVFPGLQGYPRDAVKKVCALSGVQWSPHDLRRTFLTIADSLDISGLEVKRLAGHQTQEHDVTVGYIISSPERLRRASDKITEYIDQLCPENMVAFRE